MKDEEENTSPPEENKESYDDIFPAEVRLNVSRFFSAIDTGIAKQVSKKWSLFHTDRQRWRNQIKNNFPVSQLFINLLEKSEDNSTEFICHHGLVNLTKNKQKRAQYHDIESMLTISYDFPELLLKCLLDDTTLLHWLKVSELAEWFTVSCFCSCKKIPEAILKILPINNDTLAYVVAASGNLEVMKTILSQPENSLKPNSFVLDQAVLSGNFAMVKYLLDPKNNYDLHPDYKTVYRAAQSGNLEILKYILQQTTDYTVDEELLIAAAQLGNLEIVQYLLDPHNGFNIRAEKQTLNFAVASGNIALVYFLLDPPFNLVPVQETLIAAAADDNLFLIKLFTDPKGKFNLKLDLDTLSAAAISVGSKTFSYLLDSSNNYQLHPNKKILTEAANAGNLGVVKLLLENPQYNFNTNIELLTALLNSAAKSGNIHLVKYLIETCKLNPDRDTLASAIESARFDLVKYLKNEYELIPDQNMLQLSSPYGAILFRHLLEDDLNLGQGIRGMTFAESSKALIRGLIAMQNQRPFEKSFKESVVYDPELFYTHIEHLLLSDNPLSTELSSLDIVQRSPFPHTQFYIANAASEGRIEMEQDKIIELYQKAYNGYLLLGRPVFALEVEQALNMNRGPNV